MENLTAQELNDNLLQLDVFKCKSCRRILRLPVMSIDGEGHFCINCVTNLDCQVNDELGSILSLLVVPCRFEKNGCKARCKPSLIKQHESTCTFYSLVCPYMYFNECQEDEPVMNIIEHFETVHTHSIIITETDMVRLCFHVNTSSNQLNLLVMKNEKFFVHIIRDSEEDKLHYFIYYIGMQEQTGQFSCTIEHTMSNSKIETAASLLHESCLNASYDKLGATSFNMSLLRELFKDNINVCIKIVPKSNIPFSDCYEKLLNGFECPVCNGFMRPPIFQCLAGHSICNKCRPKVSSCPTCRSNYGSTRNYVLESLSATIRYPCSFRELGCERYFSVNDISRHENECILKPFNCPFSEHLHCAWTGALNGIAGHLKLQHPDLTVCDNKLIENIPYGKDMHFFHMKVLLAYGRIFRVCHQRHIVNQNGYWSVQVIGPKGDGKKYTCHIVLIDSKNPNKTLVRTDVCQDVTTQDFMFNQCIMIPLSIVSWFSVEGQLQFHYKVLNHVENQV